MKTIDKLIQEAIVLTVIGACWGDEGKGKVIDFIAPFFDFVARFSGGANAGHTVFFENDQGLLKKVVTHLIPSGIAQGKPCVIGPGVFFDIESFLGELTELRSVVGKENMPPIIIDQNCAVRTPYHTILENWLEAVRGSNAINTTGKAIGPMAGLDALRIGIRLKDLFSSRKQLSAKLSYLHKSLEPILNEMVYRFDTEVPDLCQVSKELTKLAQRISDFVTDSSAYLRKEMKNGAKVLAEGAQAYWLDRVYGTYPYVSSGTSTNLGAPQGLGIAPKLCNKTIIVAKALPTRVGGGPFPSEIWDRKLAEMFPKSNKHLFGPGTEIAREKFLSKTLRKINAGSASKMEMSTYFQVLGDERGATTGRGRSVGYADWVMLKKAVETTGADAIALTRFDMLTGLHQIPVVTKHFGYFGEDSFANLDSVTVGFDRLNGWEDDIDNMQDWNFLPQQGRDYVLQMENFIGGDVPVGLIGTGPSREGLIVR